MAYAHTVIESNHGSPALVRFLEDKEDVRKEVGWSKECVCLLYDDKVEVTEDGRTFELT